jgi:HEAT repeat protein
MRRIAPVLMIFAVTAGVARSQPTSTSSEYKPPKEVLGESLDAWIKKLNSSDPGIREAAIRLLPLFGPDAAKAIPRMVDMVMDPDVSVRLAAVFILSSNPINDVKQLKEMFGYLNESYLFNAQTPLRTQAALAIGRMGSELVKNFPKEIADKTIPRLLSEYQLRYPGSFELRKAAAFALGRVGFNSDGSDPRAVKGLIQALNDNSVDVRVTATQSLILLGPPGNGQQLLVEKKLLHDRMIAEKGVQRIWLRVAFMRLDPKEITENNLKVIGESLDAKELMVRSAAAEALGFMGKAAASQAGRLRVGLQLANSEKPEDLDFLAKCLWAIGQMGTDAAFLINDVQPLTKHKNDQIKAFAKETLELLQGKKKN